MKLDKYEKEVLAAFQAGTLISIATKEDLERIRESARATATKDQRNAMGRLAERSPGTQVEPSRKA